MLETNIKIFNGNITKDEVINNAGNHLIELGAVNSDYVLAMHEREKLCTTYLGMGVCVPHGTDSARQSIIKTEVVVHVYPDGVDFGDSNIVNISFGIAAIENEHLDIVSNIAVMCMEDDFISEVIKLKTPLEVSKFLGEI